MKFALDDAGTVTCNVDTLITTRALVQANSGSGKSWLVRRVLEQTHKHVQQLVLDPEGEFSSLREKFDYVHAAARGGDTIAHPRSAALLAERLLELRASAILDLYELPRHDRIRFTRLFLEALMDSPKKLWHPVIVVIDEAHTFAPEKGSAESLAAVIDLSSRGRKRGFCPVLATQRIAKLHKDAAAECNNRLIGRTGLDIDLQRASDELGFKKERWRELKELAPGEFFVSGPAFNVSGVGKVKVGKVLTTHPEAGKRIAFKAPPPTSKIKALLPKLSDLPAEAEEQKKTVEQLRSEVTRLQRELTAKPAPAAPSDPKRSRTEDAATIRSLRKGLELAMKIIVQIRGDEVFAKLDPDEIKKVLDLAAQSIVGKVEKSIAERTRQIERLQSTADKTATALRALLDENVEVDVNIERNEPFRVKMPNGQTVTPVDSHVKRDQPLRRNGYISEPGGKVYSRDPRMSALGRTILTVLAQEGGPASKERVAVIAGYSLSGHFTNNLSTLRSSGYVVGGGDDLKITPEGLEALGDYERRPTGQALLQWWLHRVSKIEKEILLVLDSNCGVPLNKEQLAEGAGYAVSGHFTNQLSRLRTIGLVVGYGDDIQLASVLQP